MQTVAGSGALVGAAGISGITGIPGIARGDAADSAAGGRAFSLTGQDVLIHAPGLSAPVRIAMLADTHLHFQDERENPYSQFSGRMAGAYNRTTHAVTGRPTTPDECFAESLAAAKRDGADLVALTGDIVSFPSEANVDRVMEHLSGCGLPWMYTAGNHDWHYEGMEGTSRDLRDEWIRRRLLPLYRGDDPMISHRDIHGLRVILLDNSIYEILPEQLTAFRRLIADGLPSVLFVHIPLYAPGRPVSFGCGHPEWGAKTDNGYRIERRRPWPESGHTAATLDFYREVLASRNLLAVFAGHIHQPSVDFLSGTPLVVADDNASGGRLNIRIAPA